MEERNNVFYSIIKFIPLLVFALLVILGIVVDPTTAGVGDSVRAMGYDKPWEDEENG